MPQLTFDVTDSSGDSFVQGAAAPPWPPAYQSSHTDYPEVLLYKRWTGSDYQLSNGLVRFDTSGLPENATIVSALLRFKITGVTYPDSLQIRASYDDWTASATGFSATGSTDAISGIAYGGVGWLNGDMKDLPLDGLAGINKTGNTGLRLLLSGGPPTADNTFGFGSWDHSTAPAPQLIVNFTLPTETLRPDAILTQTNDTKSLADLQRDVV